MKTLYLRLLCFVASCAAAFAATAQVFVIPLETEINASAARHLSRGLDKALKADASLVVIKMNTFGGAVDAADSIRTALLHCPLPTVAYVDNNAASAGALIALACDSVYMSPAATMGATVVVDGRGTPMPAKYQSYMAAMMRATAEHHGRRLQGDSSVWRRNPAIAEAMVNPEAPLSLTANAAVDSTYAEGIAPDMACLLSDLGHADASVSEYRPELSDSILGFLANGAVQAVLVMLILGGIYIEMHTPGLGVAAAVSLVAATLYFLPAVITATLPAWVLICLIAGIILIALELFVIPGFGITGIAGIIAVGAALAGVAAGTATGWGSAANALMHAVIVVTSGTVAAIALALYLTSKHGPKVLQRRAMLTTELSTDKGFVGVDMTPAQYIGRHAVTTTPLRPAGRISIDGTEYPAVSTGNFISAHRPVRILRYENAQLYVEENALSQADEC